MVKPVTGLFCVNSHTGQAERATEWWRTHVANVGAKYDDPTSWHWEVRAACETCGETRADVRVRESDAVQCDACWADSLAYGHLHGMHVDDDGEPMIVDGCPSCAGAVPNCYR